MDVQAVALTPPLAPLPLAQTAPVAPSAPAPSPSVAPVSTGDGQSSGNANNGSGNNGNSNASSNSGSTSSSLNPAIGPTPGLATLPASEGKKVAAPDPTLSDGVAKLFNAQAQNVSVSYRIETNPNEIVTVFTDKQTGKVIVQFPSETLIALAKFFDKLDGNVVNKKV
jgi:hypothetical protein